MPDRPAATRPGFLLTIEGGDGAGKSTLIAALAERAGAAGWRPLVVREPGGTPLGEAVRRLLLDAATAPAARAELLLFCAARAQLVAEVILPALDAGMLVLCDRFGDSTVAYQHGGRGLPLADVQAAVAAATGGLTPDLTLVLDLDPGAARARRGGDGDYLEREPAAFHRRVREAFLAAARAEPERVRVVDAAAPAAAVADAAWAVLAPRLPASPVPPVPPVPPGG